MTDKRNKKKEPWRIAVGVLSVAMIVFLWVKNDVISVYTTAQQSDAVPLLVTTIIVVLMKVGIMAGVALLVKWMVKKMKK